MLFAISAVDQYAMKLAATEAELNTAMEMNAQCTQQAEDKYVAELQQLRETNTKQAAEIQQLQEKCMDEEQMSKMKEELDM